MDSKLKRKMYWRKSGDVKKRNPDPRPVIPEWENLESESARKMRGRGWVKFSQNVRAEAENSCQLCGLKNMYRLDTHHIFKQRTHRHLKFERWNTISLCKECHSYAELNIPKYHLYRINEYFLEGA